MKQLLVILGILIFFILITPIWTNATGGLVGMNTLEAPPAPELVSPTGETVDISGKTLLEFKWFGSFGAIDHFEFRLYKGYNMLAQDLVKKEILPVNTSSTKISTDLFEDNLVYTWSVVKVSFSGVKSDKSFSSFRIIKKI